jgi:hypothetical protein
VISLGKYAAMIGAIGMASPLPAIPIDKNADIWIKTPKWADHPTSGRLQMVSSKPFNRDKVKAARRQRRSQRK